MSDYFEAKSRPIGVSLLSILFLFGAVLGSALMVYGAFRFDWDDRANESQETLKTLGIPLPLLVASMVSLFLLAIASGVGMWKGTKWGWYLGSFWFAYALMRALNALYGVYELSSILPAEELSRMSRGPEHFYYKYGGRAGISFLLYLYFFKYSVREYFRVLETRLWKVVVSHIGICIALAIVSITLAEAMAG